MEFVTNQNAAAQAESDNMTMGLGPKQNPTTGNRRAALPRDAGESTVSKSNDKPGKRAKNNAPTPAAPEDVIRKVRRGATIAMLLAAGISARTLFQLGEIIGLPWQFAWMLPGAFDVYAYTSATVAASVPAAHPARGWAVWNARIALSFTMIGNSLVHALYLMSHGQGWTGTDYALTAVSAIPPIIVERLLHLQTKIASGADVTAADDLIGTTPGADARTQAPTKPRRQEAPTAPTSADRSADTRADVPPPPAPAADRVVGTSADDSADRGADVIDMADRGAAAKRNTDQWAADALPLYRRYIRNRGAAPNAPQLAEAVARAGLGTLGKSRARDVRKATAELHENTPWNGDDQREAGAR